MSTAKGFWRVKMPPFVPLATFSRQAVLILYHIMSCYVMLSCLILDYVMLYFDIILSFSAMGGGIEFHGYGCPLGLYP